MHQQLALASWRQEMPFYYPPGIRLFGRIFIDFQTQNGFPGGSKTAPLASSFWELIVDAFCYTEMVSDLILRRFSIFEAA